MRADWNLTQSMQPNGGKHATRGKGGEGRGTNDLNTLRVKKDFEREIQRHTKKPQPERDTLDTSRERDYRHRETGTEERARERDRH